MGGEYAGLHVLLTHLKGMTEKQLVEKAAEAGVKVYGMSDYFIDTKENKSSSTVLLGYANLSEKDIDRGCRLLKKAWLQQ